MVFSSQEANVYCPECGKMYQSSAGLRYHMGAAHRVSSPAEPKGSSPFPTPSQPLPARRAASRASELLKELTVGKVKVEEPDSAVVEESVSGESKDGGVDLDALRQKFAADGVVICPFEVRG